MAERVPQAGLFNIEADGRGEDGSRVDSKRFQIEQLRCRVR